MTAPTLFRAYIGPHWRPANNSHAWDWTRGQDFAFADKNGRLLATLSDTVTTVDLTFDTQYLLPPKGGLWIGPSPSPNATNSGWEYVDYSSYTTYMRPGYTNYQLAGLQREPSTTREHNGVHYYDSSIHFWAPLQTNDGKLHITEEMDANLCTNTWSAELSGVLAPRAFMRNNHAVLIRTRPHIAASWSNLLLGWIEEFQIEDDYRRYAKWSLRITSIAGILNRQHCPPIRIGDLDIAQAGKVIKTAQILAHPSKEMNSGDFTAADPDLSGDSLIDGNPETVCIFERTLGPDGRNYNAEEAMLGSFYVGQMNITIPPGLGKGYRWLAIYVAKTNSETRFQTPIFANSVEAEAHWQGGLNGYADRGSRIIMCENLNKFMAMNPLADPTRIAECGSAFFDNLNVNPAEGEVLGIGDGSAPGWQNSNPIAWGANPPAHAFYKRNDGTDESRHRWNNQDIGGFPTPQNGQIVRFMYDATKNVDQMFILTNCDTVGYTEDVAPWALIQLPSMGLRLNVGMSKTATGLIYITDGTVPTTNGLPASGTIQIGFEQMTFDNKTATSLNITARGVNGTNTSIHDANDQVLVVVDGQATNAFHINHVSIKRNAGDSAPRDYNSPKTFVLRAANSIVMPRMPDHDDEDPSSAWYLDYQINSGLVTVADGTTEYHWYLNNRANWLLVELHSMQYEPARPRLNSVEAWLDTTYFDPDQWMPEGTTIGQAYTHIFDMLGIPSAAVNDCTENAEPFELLTGAKPAWPTLVDMADYTNTLIAIDYLNNINIHNNIMWDTDVVSGNNGTFDRTNAKQVTMIQERSGAVKQLKMEWVQTDGSAGGTIIYPDPEYLMGDYKTAKSNIYPSAELAMASLQRRFIVMRFPATIAVQTAIGNLGVHTGLFYGLDWTFHDGSRAARTGFAQSVDHILENTNWQTAVRLVALRSAEY